MQVHSTLTAEEEEEVLTKEEEEEVEESSKGILAIQEADEDDDEKEATVSPSLFHQDRNNSNNNVMLTTTTTSASSTVIPMWTWRQLPVQVRVQVLSYFDPKKQKELKTFQLVSKSFYHDCQQQLHRSLAWQIDHVTLVLRPKLLRWQAKKKKAEYSRTEIFFRKLYDQYHQSSSLSSSFFPSTMLEQYRYLKVKNVHRLYEDPIRRADRLITTAKNIHLTGIVSLDLSLKMPLYSDLNTLNDHTFTTFPKVLARIVPNLQSLDVSGTTLGSSVVAYFSKHCPRLETVTWNQTPYYVSISADGADFRHSKQLKELICDHSSFHFEANMKRTMAEMTIRRRKTDFLLYKCCTGAALERISIRQATVSDSAYGNPRPIPQNILMKFVRRAPSTLIWFRSDLSKGNMQRLRLERPGIELVN